MFELLIDLNVLTIDLHLIYIMREEKFLKIMKEFKNRNWNTD